MNYRKSVLSVAVAASFVCASLPVFSAEFLTADAPIKGQYIVVLKDNAASLAHERSNLSRVSTVARSMATQHRARLVRSYSNVLRGFVVRADDKSLARLLADSRVAYVHEDGYARLSATQSNATWGLDRIDQRNLPLDKSYSYDNDAAGVNIYIVDSGLESTHADFSGRTIGRGYSAIADGLGTADCNGHGTHVASTAAGNVWGVAKGATIHPVRVLDCEGSGAWSGLIAGAEWVMNNHVKPAVANMSLGGVNAPFDEAVAKLIGAGVTVVVAAGNNDRDACLNTPAKVPAAITVGATDNSDTRSQFYDEGVKVGASAYGTCVDVFAPGSDIEAAWYDKSHWIYFTTWKMDGTSMASPHVAGVAAQYLAVNPSATPKQVHDAIVNNATPNLVKDAGLGSPNRMLHSLFGSAPPPPPPPTAQTYSNGTDYAIRDNATVTSPISVSGRSGYGSSSTPVTVNIVHTYIGDLKVDLIAPDKSVYVLHSRAGGSADNINKTYTVNLSNELLNGTWTLRVNDNAGGDTGLIDKWSVTF